MRRSIRRPRGSTSTSSAAAPAAATGSAYLATLLVLVVLTILGLSLALVTQTEMQIGANELVIQRAFYAADSGVAAVTARALVEGDHRALQIVLPGEERGGVDFETAVDVSPFVRVQFGFCNLCSINQGSEFFQIVHGINSSSTRRATDPEGDVTEQAEKLISVMVEVQPWELTVVDLGDYDLTQLKF